MTRLLPFALAMFLVSGAARAQADVPDKGTSSPIPDAAPTSPRPVATTEPRSDSDDELESRPFRPKHRFFGSLDGGYGYQNLYDTPITGFDLTLVLGGDMGKWSVGGIIDFDRGVTLEGLATTTCTVGALFEGHIDRLRLGGGIRMGGISIDRVTEPGDISSATLGLFVRGSFDIATFNEGRSAVFLVAKGSVDTVGTALWSGTAGAGVRF